ncbi:hypothetical protein ABI59_06985 [Acidobacteria bacterium Mor1]|nr:hypothetical protein ABI59_06985 [Acidobacteria bacterium Mor1]
MALSGTQRTIASGVLLMIAMALVTGLRFNRVDHLIGGVTAGGADARVAQADAAYYVDVVRFLRGEAPGEPLAAPYTRRPLAPWLASHLPLEPLTALNVVNFLSLCGAALLLYASLLRLTGEPRIALLGGALFVFSFPTFYYGTIGYVDPVLLLFLSLFAYGLAAGSNGVMLSALIAGCLVRESMLIALLPFVVAQLRARGQGIAWSVAGIGACLLATYVAWGVIPFEQDRSHGLTTEWFVAGLSQLRSWLSLALTFGLPGLLLIWLVAGRARRERLASQPLALPLLAGLAASATLVLVAFGVAVVDGRPLWTAYPFAILLIGMLMSDDSRPVIADR